MTDDLFRKVYTPLTEEQKEAMLILKESGEEILAIMGAMVPKDERSERSRCMAIARTNLETAIMYAVKAVTTKADSQ
jgi:hypothetical protein